MRAENRPARRCGSVTASHRSNRPLRVLQCPGAVRLEGHPEMPGPDALSVRPLEHVRLRLMIDGPLEQATGLIGFAIVACVRSTPEAKKHQRALWTTSGPGRLF